MSTEDSGTARISVGIDNHSSVMVETHITAVSSSRAVRGANDNATDLVAGFYFSAGNSLLYGANYDIPEPRGSSSVFSTSSGASKDFDTLGDLGPGVVGNRYSGLHLNHSKTSRTGPNGSWLLHGLGTIDQLENFPSFVFADGSTFSNHDGISALNRAVGVVDQ